MTRNVPSWLRPARPEGWMLELHVQPGARVTAPQGEHGGALKLKLAAPPVDGKANTELQRFLARALGVARADIELVAGQTSRQKRIWVKAAIPAQVIVSALGEGDTAARGG